LSDDGL
jgi:hypothetical protein